MKKPAIDLQTLKSCGAISLSQPGLCNVRLYVVGGALSAAQLQAVAKAAVRFGDRNVHLTTRQGVEITRVPEGKVEALRDFLKKSGVRVRPLGPFIRAAVACPGTDCRCGLIPTQELAKKLAQVADKYGKLPGKLKVAVTGCPNACAKPLENDFGVMGKVEKQLDTKRCTVCGACVKGCHVGALSISKGKLQLNDKLCLDCGRCVDICQRKAWRKGKAKVAVFVGGKMGRLPLLGQRLPSDQKNINGVLTTMKKVADWYIKNGNPRERLGDAINRIGLKKMLREVGQR